MSLRWISTAWSGTLHSPVLVASAGAAVVVWILPMASAYTKRLPENAVSLNVLAALNLSAFALNCLAVSIPGRIDDGTALVEKEVSDDDKSPNLYQTVYSPNKGRSLVTPAGWAFAIWGPIYIGEALLCASMFVASSSVRQQLPVITAPFVAANTCQSLWCASFRPSYMNGSAWKKYVSVAMLGATAYCLSQVDTTSMASMEWFYIAVKLHYGWTTAATLVNLNGSMAVSNALFSDSTVAMAGHASAVTATVLGLAVTYTKKSPTYGFTLAWALAACAAGMTSRLRKGSSKHNSTKTAEATTAALQRQERLCRVGAALCAAVASVVLVQQFTSSQS